MSKKLLLVDGSSMLSTAYYGNLPKSVLFSKTVDEQIEHFNDILHTSDGLYTNGMYVMLKQLFKLKEYLNPDYMVVAFDKSRNTFRRTELGAEFYKANRKPTPSPLSNQFIQIEEFLDDIGIKVVYDDNYEADDLIASYANKFASDDVDVIIHSKDHDFMQLVSSHVRLFRPVSDSVIKKFKSVLTVDELNSCLIMDCGKPMIVYDSYIVKKDTGVFPYQITDLLAIAGDAGDGIPGCRGVSSAAPLLLDNYLDIDEIYNAIDTCTDVKSEKELAAFWKNELHISRSPLKALKADRENVILSKKLATMKRDIFILEGLNSLVPVINKNKLKNNLLRYEMSSLLYLCN